MRQIDIAHVIHEANRAVQMINDEEVSPPWEDAPAWMQQSTFEGVIAAQEGMTPAQLHENWMVTRTADGWIYGEVKDSDAKTHPCLVPYDELPLNQRIKDHLFHGIVSVLSSGAEVNADQHVPLPAAVQPTIDPDAIVTPNDPDVLAMETGPAEELPA